MKINQKYKYWELYFDEEIKKQLIGSIWAEEWSNLKLLSKSENELSEHLLLDIEDKYKYEGLKVNRGLVKHAISELKKIKGELKL